MLLSMICMVAISSSVVGYTQVGGVDSYGRSRLFESDPNATRDNRMVVDRNTGAGRTSIAYDNESRVVIGRKRNLSNRASGMRVCIYFDNGQQARAGADQALSVLREMYPNLKGEVVYQNPFFKVMAGSCLDRIEAARLLGVLRNTFPGAIIVNETMPLENFIIEESDSQSSLPEDPLSRPLVQSDSLNLRVIE